MYVESQVGLEEQMDAALLKEQEAKAVVTSLGQQEANRKEAEPQKTQAHCVATTCMEARLPHLNCIILGVQSLGQDREDEKVEKR
jgi:hypothetical protein